MPDAQDLARAFAEARPEAAARALETVGPKAAAAFLAGLPDELAARLLESMLPSAAAAALRDLPRAATAAVMRRMAARAIAAVLRQADAATRDRVLGGLPPVRRSHVTMILRQPLQTVGAWVDTRIPVARSGDSAAHGRDLLAGHDAPDARVYVLDSERRLVGTVPPGALVKAAPDDPVESLVEPPGAVLSANDTVEAALEAEVWATHDTLPVADAGGRFMGRVRHADLRRAVGGAAQGATRPGGESPLGVADLWHLGLAAVLESAVGRPRATRLGDRA